MRASLPMAFNFQPATRENVPLILGLAGASGAGKSYSAMRVAKGMAGEKRFAVIDTERGRAKHYADFFAFDHCELDAPFSPDRYEGAILEADKIGYPVIVVDSASHEQAGEGGLLEMHDAELERISKGSEERREAVNMAAWIKPKLAHKAMVGKLLRVRAHVILCFRAEEKVEMLKVDGKWKVVPKKTLSGIDGWVPICEKTLPYELTASFLLTPAQPGIPRPIKLQEQHRSLIPLDKPLDEEVGRKLAEWAAGGGEDVARLRERAFEMATQGLSKMQEWWASLTNAQRKLLDRDSLRKVAEQADAQRAEA